MSGQSAQTTAAQCPAHQGSTQGQTVGTKEHAAPSMPYFEVATFFDAPIFQSGHPLPLGASAVMVGHTRWYA
jgi:hypothetical protein